MGIVLILGCGGLAILMALVLAGVIGVCVSPSSVLLLAELALLLVTVVACRLAVSIFEAWFTGLHRGKSCVGLVQDFSCIRLHVSQSIHDIVKG